MKVKITRHERKLTRALEVLYSERKKAVRKMERLDERIKELINLERQ